MSCPDTGEHRIVKRVSEWSGSSQRSYARVNVIRPYERVNARHPFASIFPPLSCPSFLPFPPFPTNPLHPHPTQPPQSPPPPTCPD